ncbi:MAG TPA: thioredoxin domain-containing protein [Candidatus Magasanikbacteria bacterium]|nr:thioredoxin domain-containing protein [Candidatus Magasanikbacteria bacterium]
MTTKSLKILGYSLLTLIGIIFIVFLYFFIYFTWQLRYGSPETLATLTRTLDGTFTKEVDADAPTFRADYKSFIRSYNPTLGNPNAPVEIIMFIDFECPYCQASFPVFKQIIDSFGDGVSVVFKQFPLTTIHPNARAAAEASMCAEEQGKFWKFYDRAFSVKRLDESSLYTYAVESGLNTTAFDACFKDKKYAKSIDQDLADGVELGVRGTPTYIINGQFVEGVTTFDEWKTLLLDVLNRK